MARLKRQSFFRDTGCTDELSYQIYRHRNFLQDNPDDEDYRKSILKKIEELELQKRKNDKADNNRRR